MYIRRKVFSELDNYGYGYGDFMLERMFSEGFNYGYNQRMFAAYYDKTHGDTVNMSKEAYDKIRKAEIEDMAGLREQLTKGNGYFMALDEKGNVVKSTHKGGSRVKDSAGQRAYENMAKYGTNEPSEIKKILEKSKDERKLAFGEGVKAGEKEAEKEVKESLWKRAKAKNKGLWAGEGLTGHKYGNRAIMIGVPTAVAGLGAYAATREQKKKR